MILSVLHNHCGQFELAAQLGEQLYQRACQSGTPIHQVWGVAVQAINVLGQGDADDAIRLVGLTLGLIDESGAAQPDIAILAHGVLATARTRQGKLDLAIEAARAATTQIASSSGVGYMTASGFKGVAEVYLTVWEEGDRDIDGVRVSRRALQACQAVTRYAKRYRSAEPAALLFQARAHWLRGRSGLARRVWRRSLTAAERLSMPYDQGLAHYEFGRHLDAGDPARGEHLGKAAEIFARLGAAYDVARAGR